MMLRINRPAKTGSQGQRGKLHLIFGLLLVFLLGPGQAVAAADFATSYFFQQVRRSDKGRQVMRLKIIRNPYVMEQVPFSLAPETMTVRFSEAGSNRSQTTRTLLAGQSGYLLEFPLPSGPGKMLNLNGIEGWIPLDRKQENIEPVRLDQLRLAEVVDPYTGNRFSGELVTDDGERPNGFIILRVHDAQGILLAKVGLNIFLEAPLTDLNQGSWVEKVRAVPEKDGEKADITWEANAAEEPDGYFWLTPGPLADFVYTYAQDDGAAYARYLVDGYLLQVIASSLNARLPFLPRRDLLSGIDPAGTVSVEQRPATVPYQGSGLFNHSHICSLVPMLKILEERAGAGPAGAQTAPDYSEMQLYAELLRRFPGQKEFSFLDVAKVIAERGLCREEAYPFSQAALAAHPQSPQELAKAVQAELAGANGAAAAPPWPEGIPPACAEQAEKYRQQHRPALRDWVLLVASEHLNQKGRSELKARHYAAQREELFWVALARLQQGQEVAIAKPGHALLAYGLAESGILVMDSSEKNESLRETKIIPFDQAQKEIIHIAFLRPGQDSSTAIPATGGNP